MFKEVLEKFDKHMIENQTQIFGNAKNAKKYTYQPIVRQSRTIQDSDSESDDEEKEVVARPDYTKAKIPLDYNTEKVQVEVFQKNKKDSEAYEKDGSHTDIEISTLDDLKTCRLHAKEINMFFMFLNYGQVSNQLMDKTLECSV